MKIRTRFATFLFLSLVLFLTGNLFLLSFFGQKYFAIYQIELSQSLTQANFQAFSQAISTSSKASSGITLEEYSSLLKDLEKMDTVLQKVEGRLSAQSMDPVDPKQQLVQFFTSIHSDHAVETLFQGDSPEAHFVQRLLRDILLANLLFLSGVIGSTFFLFRSTLGPLKGAVDRARIIARTHDYIPIDYMSHDEISPLISSFNRILTELSRQSSSRDQVVRDMAHEIATPLMAMKSLIEAISDRVLPYTDTIGEQILDQITKIEYLSRRILSLESTNHKEVHRQAIHVHSFIATFFYQYETLFAKQGQSYELNVQDSEVIAMDPIDLERILHNIATNFSKYAGENTRLNIGLKKQTRWWVLYFADNGAGVEQTHLQRLGTLFYRADMARSVSSGIPSSGLGITLIEKVVSRYMGYIRINSDGPNKGFSVYVYLPR